LVDDDDLGFEMVAASLRADAGDVNAFLPALAVKLEGALPGRCSVRRRGSMFGGKKTVQAIEVDLGETRFHIEEDHGRLVATRQKAVRGIVLKNEELPLDAWIDELSHSVAEEARSSQTGRDALQRMLENT
jgi:hypothetical protein